MKFLKNFGLGMVSLMLCAGFVSCGDDEPKGGNNDSGTEVPVFEKRLVKCSDYYKSSERYFVKDFYYDEDGNVNMWKTYFTDKNGVISSSIYEYPIHWSGNTCYTEYEGEKEQEFIYDTSGKAVSWTNNTSLSSASEEYEYDDKGRLLRSSFSGTNETKDQLSNECTYTWKGNRLVSVIHKFKQTGKYDESVTTTTFEISYTGRKVNGAFVPVTKSMGMFLNSELVDVHPERFGALTNELPSKVTKSRNSTKTLLAFKVDNKVTTLHSEENEIFLLEDVKVDPDGYLVGANTKTEIKTCLTNYNLDKNGDGKISKDEEVEKIDRPTVKSEMVVEFVWANK